MLISIPLALVGLVLIRTAFAPEPDPRVVLANLFTGKGLGIGGGAGKGMGKPSGNAGPLPPTPDATPRVSPTGGAARSGRLLIPMPRIRIPS